MSKTDIFCYKEKEKKLEKLLLKKLISVRSGFSYELFEINYALVLLELSFSHFLADLDHMSLLWPLEGFALFQHQNAMALC